MDTQHSTSSGDPLLAKIQQAKLPDALRERLIYMHERLKSATAGGQPAVIEHEKRYIDLVLSLPWETMSKDNLDLANARAILEKNHYGMGYIKERIIEYLSVLHLKKERQHTQSESPQGEGLRAPILCFVGLVGTGKTTLAYSIAESMGRSFVRIPFGGMGSALDLRGQSRIHAEAEPGHIIKALARCKTKNPVLLLDEIDRVSDAGRADIMGVLVELLDPEQNKAYTDHYIDYPFDLTQVLFVATANNTRNIATAVLDRLEVIKMPSYTDEEKIVIGRDYIFPKALSYAGLTKDQVTINEEVWASIVRPLGYDAGMRTLERTINGICRKIAKAVVEKKATRFTITKENVKEYLPSE